MTRFLHTADWQLGMTRHFLDGEAQARFTAARIDVIDKIGSLAVAEKCSFVVVGGDVFESNQVERQVVVRALDAMKATPGVTFYLLPGNHDPLDASSIFRSATFVQNCPPNVIVLDSTAEVIAAGGGVVVVGAPWPNKRPLTDLVSAAVKRLPSDGTLRVVVGHGAVDTMSPDPADPARVVVDDIESALADGRIHYVALGDRHSTTDVGSTGRIWYSGAPEPTDYDETDPGNVLVVDLTSDSIAVERRHLGTWRFKRQEFDLAGAADCDEVRRFLDEIPDKKRTIVKLALVGQLSLAEMARLDEILDHASDLLAVLERWERRSELVALPDDGDFDGLGLSGFAAEALQDLRDMGAGSGDEAVTARDALGLLYRLTGVGS